jgi:hypothetical protein
MVQTALPASADDDRPFPRVPELIRLSFRSDRLLASDDEQDAQLAAKNLDYVAALTAELDRVRPPGKRRPLP